MSIGTGTRLGPYEILAPLGAGGMGEVYKARDTRLDRQVAVKILPAALSDNAQLRLRFEREARAISSLAHPNICTLHDVGQENGIDYLVLEYIDGESLASRISRGRLPLEQVLAYGAQIAEGLDSAHRSGVIHRDLKPGNIMLTKSGAKLLDFGLAKYAHPASVSGVFDQEATEVGAATERRSLTAEGTIVGTFQYMAPEQLEGAESDARTDIFALGAVLYEMATGRRAFDGKNRTSLIAAIVSSQPPPLSQIEPLTPPALDHVIQRCLEKDPGDRWQSARDVAAELRWISEQGSAAGVAAPLAAKRKRREWSWIAIATVLALIAASLAGILWTRREAPQRTMRLQIAPPPQTGFHLFGDGPAAVTISPDGRWITFETRGDDPRFDSSQRLWLRPIDSTEAKPIATHAIYPFWSPDSRSIAYFSGGKLKRVDVGGGPELTICDAPEPRGGTWNEEGTIIFAPHWRGPLARVPASGGRPEPVTTLDPARSETTHRYPWFLPDGRHFIYLGGTHGADARSELNAVYLGSTDGKVRRLLLHARSNVIYTAGHLLFVRDRYLLAQPFDARRLELEGEPRRVADGVHYESGFFRAAFAAANDGTIVFAPEAGTNEQRLRWVERTGEVSEPFGEAARFRNIRVSPDGRQAAAPIGDPSDIWVWDLARGTRRRLTFDPMNEMFPVWSPDQKTIAYASDREGTTTAIYTRMADGNGAETLLLNDANAFCDPSDWSSDGNVLLFTRSSADTSHSDIWALPLSGDRQPFPLIQSPFNEWDAVFSPDGRWIAYYSEESGRGEVYVTSFPTPGARHQISTSGALSGPSWTGSEIFYVSSDLQLQSVRITGRGENFDAGMPQSLFGVSRRGTGDTLPGGQRFLVAQPVEEEKPVNLTVVMNWQ